MGVALACALAAAGCQKKAGNEAPVATPSMTVSQPRPPLGSPLDITYKFVVSPNAPPFGQDYWVMAHFVDPDREQMWTDDHQPPTPTSQWKPGQTITYTRTMFVPVYPYIGPATIEVGLFSPTGKTRLPLDAHDEGQRSYKVASIELRPQSDNIFLVYKDGWHAAEVASDNNAVAWQWTKGDGNASFRNPQRDVTMFLDVDAPVEGIPGGQNVEVRVNDGAVDTFAMPPRSRQLRRIKVSKDQLGAAENVNLQVHVDKTFVPARVPELHSTDTRELGVRVFHLFVQ